MVRLSLVLHFKTMYRQLKTVTLTQVQISLRLLHHREVLALVFLQLVLPTMLMMMMMMMMTLHGRSRVAVGSVAKTPRTIRGVRQRALPQHEMRPQKEGRQQRRQRRWK